MSTIGPFTGDAQESFEDIAPPGSFPGPMPIFDGEATMDDQFSDPVITTSLSDPNNSLFPFDGNLMGLTPTGLTTFTFETPALRFGGYFGMVTEGVPGGSVSFLDDRGGTIETMDFNLEYNEWVWRGWESDVPIAAIEMQTGPNPGIPTVFDSMEVTYVPAPGAAALLGLGACVARRRRRH